MVVEEARDREDATELLGVGLIVIAGMQHGEEIRYWVIGSYLISRSVSKDLWRRAAS